MPLSGSVAVFRINRWRGRTEGRWAARVLVALHTSKRKGGSGERFRTAIGAKRPSPTPAPRQRRKLCVTLQSFLDLTPSKWIDTFFW
jgi:hypothetical protein